MKTIRIHINTMSRSRLLAACVILLLTLFGGVSAQGGEREDLEKALGPGGTNWVPPKFGPGTQAVIATVALNGGAVTPQVLVADLLDLPKANCAVMNETFNGAANPVSNQGGQFTGGGLLPVGPIGIPSGVILSSGNIASVIGGPAGMCNQRSSTSTVAGTPGDPNLNAIVAPRVTFDRAALEFDITCIADTTLGFRFVFASEEYNEWALTQYNDAIGIFVNNVNVARLPMPFWAIPVTVNTVNNGNPFGAANRRNFWHFVNNQCGVGGLGPYPCAPPNRETEMDGLTQFDGRNTPLFARGTRLLAGQQYHVKLVVADTSDRVYDSNLFVKGIDAGACCLSGGLAVDGVALSDCNALGGTYTDGKLVNEIECGTTGACYSSSGCIPNVSMQTCLNTYGGAYAGDATSCGPTGACCLPNLTCAVRTADACEAEGGTYKGDGTTCSAGLCTGACCDPTLATCSDLTPAECASRGGEFLGDFPCRSGICAPVFAGDRVPALPSWGLVLSAVIVLGTGAFFVFRRMRG